MGRLLEESPYRDLVLGKKSMDIIMQIRQRKGKHANGPYWVRVRDGYMGRRKFMMEGGKEQPRASDCVSVTSQ